MANENLSYFLFPIKACMLISVPTQKTQLTLLTKWEGVRFKITC